MRLRVLALLIVLGLSGCASHRAGGPVIGSASGPAASGVGPDAPARGVAPPRDAPEAFAALAARDAALRPITEWAFKGRIAVARGGDGGTLGVHWIQRGEAFDIRLSAPVTGRQWRLYGRSDGATLEGLEGGPRQGPDAERLLLEITGWRLPIRQLPDWLRGLRGPGPVAGLEVDAAGRPVAFQQDAWQLAYRDWWAGEPPLPRRVFAETREASVRLVVSGWETVAPSTESGPAP